MILDIPGVTERRQSPRYEVELDVDLVLENGALLTVQSRNISSCGMQVICDSWVADEIEPRGIQKYNPAHIRFKVVTELPVDGESRKLYSSGRIMSVQRLSQDTFMLNVAFIDFQNGSDRYLDEFLDNFAEA